MAPPPRVAPEAVQGTNDESIVSKRSAVRLRYYADPYLRIFVAKAARRSPLVNRGYAARVAAVRHVINTFVRRYADVGPVQVVSLGAGFDSTALVLATAPEFADRELLCIDVDFPALVRRKLALLRGFDMGQLPTDDAAALRELLAGVPVEDGRLLGSRYAVVGADLRDLAAVIKTFGEAGFDGSRPTLFFSECVLTYVPPRESNAVMGHCRSLVGPGVPAAFLTYEQFMPLDAFGSVMCGTLDARASSLRCVHHYPSLDLQCGRYTDAGWERVAAASLSEFFYDRVPAATRESHQSIEPFDEFEDWHSTNAHYFVLLAQTPECDLDVCVPRRRERVCLPVQSSWGAQFLEPGAETGRMAGRKGHASAFCPSLDAIFVSGGFGGRRHARLADVVLIREGGECQTIASQPDVGGSPSDLPSALVHASATFVGTLQGVVVFGGREGPARPSGHLFLFSCKTLRWSRLDTQGDAPPARWRHCAALITPTTLLVLGGCGVGGQVLADAWLLDVPTLTWTRAADGEPRHSCAILGCAGERAVLVHGGMGADEMPRGDLVRYELGEELTCRVLSQDGPSRSSHAMVAVPDTADAILVGGVDLSLMRRDEWLVRMHIGGDGAVSWSMSSRLVFPDRIPVAPDDAEFANEIAAGSRELVAPPALMSHTAHLWPGSGRLMVVGGGLNCFSFGTHLNALVAVVWELQIEGVAWAPVAATGEEDAAPSLRRVVPRIETLPASAGAFEAEIVDQRRPVCIGKIDLGDWSPSTLLERCPADARVSVHVCPERLMDFCDKNFGFRTVPLREFVEGAFSGQAPERMYLRSLGANARKQVSDIRETFPDLAAHLELPAFLETTATDPGRFFSSALRVSTKDVQVWTHYDTMDNVLVQVLGRKRVYLWPPSDYERMYMSGSSSRVVDVENPDLERFPLFAKATRYEVILEPGDMLFIPALWFHNTLTLDASLSVNYFWKHLRPAERFYPAKDLYGNKDLVPVAEARAEIGAALAKLAAALPAEYAEFYRRALVEELLGLQ